MITNNKPAESLEAEVHIYQPGQRAGWGISVWREMFAELAKSRELMWRLFLRDFMARYKQSVLGVLWAAIMPLGVVATFMLLNSAKIFNFGDLKIPFPAFALLGLSIWQLFSGGVGACTGAIVSGGNLVKKINFPRETLLIVAYGHVIFDVLIRLVLVLVVFAIYGIVPKWTVIFFPLSLIPLLFFSLGLGFLLSLFNALIKDIGHIVGLGITFLFFLTPIIYETPRVAIFTAITKYSPLAGLVKGARDLVISGSMTEPFHYIWASVLSVALFLFAWRVFHVAEMRITERLGAR